MTGSPALSAKPRRVPPSRGMERLLRGMRRAPGAAVAAIVLALLVAAAMAAPLIAFQNPYDLAQIDFMDGTLPPGSTDFQGHVYLLGTDDQGRDMLSAMLYGLRLSLIVGASATLVALVIGCSIGIVSAYVGGRTEALIMRIVDIQLSFPAILIALVLLSTFGQGVDKVILALITVQWAYYARAVRSVALSELDKDYISAARSLRLSHANIIFSQLAPNCIGPILVISGIQVAQAILLEATLSFLGLGLPITQPSLGLLISNGFVHLLSGAYWISIFPGLVLFTTIMCINLVVDHLRDALSPDLK